MNSNEEIEKAKEDLRFFNEGDYITREMSHSANVLEKYIEQLETKEQKLIEKLEKDRIKNNEFEFFPLQAEKAYNNYYKLGKIDLIDELLEILKGEKE